MILYFADRQMNIIGKASTTLPEGRIIFEDIKTEEVETGVSTFSCYIGYTDDTRAAVEAMTTAGNYLLRSHNGENEFYTIIDSEGDTKNRQIYIYAEDAGLDLINEIVGEYEAEEAKTAEWYINKYIEDSGFEIGICEIPSDRKLKLSWEGEATVTERLASIATQFGGFEVSYSYEIKGLEITRKYINIYEKRGEDNGLQLRLDRDIDRIITSKSVANLATAFLCEGGVPDDDDKPITFSSTGHAYDDGDFFIDGDKLKSRKANEKWSRYIWNKEPNKQGADGGYIVRPYSYNTTDPETLRNHAIAELKKICDMEINYEIDINKLPEGVRIGDRVNIIDDAGELYVSTRILMIESSVVDGKYKATLGEHIIKKSGISQKVEELASKFAETSQSAARAFENAKKALADAESAKGNAETAAQAAADANAAAGQAAQSAGAALVSAQEAQSAVNSANELIEQAAASVEEIKGTVDTAQAAAAQAEAAAKTAEEKAGESKAAAENAAADLLISREASEKAEAAAAEAVTKADSSISISNEAKTLATDATTTANAAKEDAAQAAADVLSFGENLAAYQETVEASFARKTELSETSATLQAQITENANGYSELHSKVVTIDETSNDAKEKADAAQEAASDAQTTASEAAQAAEAAQAEAELATQAAEAAQSEADLATQAAEEAKTAVAEAESNLESAKANLAAVSARVDATEEEIATAQAAVATAQAAADKAKQDAAAAAEEAANAQSKADTAAADAQTAQAEASAATAKATAAESAAANAQGEAAAAISTANEATATASAAQAAAATAVSDAAEAQAQAAQAISNAAAAEEAAKAADNKAKAAQDELDTAKQNLEETIGRVDATEEEIAAAQAAVAAAQEAADLASQNAETAQEIAAEAKDNAETAQEAADAAQEAADAAQAAADAAQTAADTAQAAADALAIRVEGTETEIEKTNEEILLRAKQSDLELLQQNANELSGRLTTAEAEILTQGGEISLKASKKEMEVAKIYGRNFAHTSVITHTVPTENWEAVTMVLWRITKAAEYTGTYINGKVLFEDETYTLSYKFQKIAGSLVNIGGHLGGVDVLKVTVDGEDKAGYTTGIEMPDDVEEHFVTLTFVYKGSDHIHIQPNRGVATSITYDLWNIKLEKGEEATEWTHAPEDLLNEIYVAQTVAKDAVEQIGDATAEIKVLADSISNLVRGNAGGSLVKQDENGLYYFDISKLLNDISEQGEALDNIDGIVRGANGEIDVLKSTAQALQNKVEYIRSYTDDNGQPCLELGEGDSTFKVRITNTEIQFEEEGAVPAKINRKMLVIEKTMIKNELQFGDDKDANVSGVWIWKRRANGNLGLSWKGGVE